MATLTNGSPALLGTNKLGPGMRSTRAEAEAARNRRRKDTRNTARLALADETDKLTTGAGKFRHLSTAQRDTLLGHTSAANRSIVFRSCQEGRHEEADRMWRRWIGFGRHTGYTADPFLALLSNNERELYTKAFLQCYRVSTWSTNGDVTGTRPRPLVASTVRQAAGHLAAAFRNDLRPSPIHVTGSSHLRPFIRALFRSYENDDPPRNQQRAITPKLLRAMYLTAGTSVEITRDTEFAIISELAIMAYFFAMRSCEFTLTPQTGRTRIVRLRGITFWDAKKRELPHRSPQITSATRVTITFEDQKNGVRMEKRTQRSTSDPVLCPVKRIRSLVERIYRRVPDANPDTSINATFLETVRSQITGSALRLFMRSTCTLKGGRPTFGFNAVDIGTRSLRSGAAMGLFLMNHPVMDIMMMGRWVSDAFLVYIRPQVLEWTDNMSTDMIKFNTFTDATNSRKAPPSDPRTRRRLFNGPGKEDGAPVVIEALHLHH